MRIDTNTTNFDKVLTSGDVNVQTAFETLDEAIYIKLTSVSTDSTLTGTGTVANPLKVVQNYLLKDSISSGQNINSDININSGTLTVTDGIISNVTGNVTGDVIGDVTGDLTGNADTVTNGVYTNSTNYVDLTDNGATTLHKHDHDNMDGKDLAGSGVTYGHIDNQTQTIEGSKTFTSDITLPDNIKVNLGTGLDGAIYSSGDNLYVENTTSDKDIIVRINDGGVNKNLITVDASENTVQLTGDLELTSGDITIDNNSKLFVGTGLRGRLYNSSDNLVISNLTTNKDIKFIVDDGGVTRTPLIIDASANQLVIGSGTQIGIENNGLIYSSSDDVYIDSITQDKDIIIRGNDGGVQTTILTIDSSESAIKLKNGVAIDEFSIDGTLAGNSDLAVSTEKATKTYVDTAIPAGIIISFAGVSTPTGYLLCDGSAVSRTTYSTLFTAISTTWGAGDTTTTFNVPDLRGAFLRGTGSHGTSNMANGNDFAGPAVGAFENDQMQGHKHLCNVFWSAGASVWALSHTDDGLANDPNAPTSVPYTDGTNGTPRTGDETRPFSAGITYIIKY